jgi:hypothetical protein
VIRGCTPIDHCGLFAFSGGPILFDPPGTHRRGLGGELVHGARRRSVIHMPHILRRPGVVLHEIAENHLRDVVVCYRAAFAFVAACLDSCLTLACQLPATVPLAELLLGHLNLDHTNLPLHLEEPHSKSNDMLLHPSFVLDSVWSTQCLSTGRGNDV